MAIDTSKMFQELNVNGDTFGSVRYFEAKRKNTVFSLCSSGGSEVDCEGMLKKLKDLIKKQIDEVGDDFKSAKGDLLSVSDSRRKSMSAFIDALYNAIQKVGGSFSKSELKQYLSEADSPYKSKPGIKTPFGKNGAELCSSSYMDKIASEIFSSSKTWYSYSSNAFSSAIDDDIKKISSSIYDDLKNSLSSIYRVNESHKKSMIDAMETFRRISYGNKAVEVVGLLNYTVELTLPIPEQQSFGLSRPTLKPVKFTIKELIKGHQDFEEYLRRKGNTQLHTKARYITAEYVEKYSSEISKIIKAALVLDTDDEVIYIVLYVGDAEVFRKKYTDVSYKWYVKDGNKRLSEYSLKCKRFSDDEVDRMNGLKKSPLDGIIDGAGIIGDGASHLNDLGNTGNVLSLPGLIRDTLFNNFVSNKAEHGDFLLYYGNADKGYGGHFNGRTFQKR